MSIKTNYQDESKNAIIGSIKDTAQTSDDEFMAWFDPAENVTESISRGYWDFSFNILKKKLCKYTSNAHEKTALEIGYGGGRLLNAACKYYKHVVGIDIHDEQKKVAKFLKENGNKNFELIKTSGNTIDYESESVDLVYSFIVLCHMDSLDTFICYLKESYRCLKPGGIAQLYYAARPRSRRMRLEVELKGHISSHPDLSKVNGCMVLPYTYIKPSLVHKLSKKVGFKIVDKGIAYAAAPDGYPQKKGIQSYCTLLKD